MTAQTRLPRRTLCAFAAPTFGEQIMLAPIFGILPALYAENTLVSLQMIGVMFMIARIFDAFSDPAIGYLSDITKSRFGQRKPWILAGAVVAAISVLFLYQPPPNANATYFFVACMAYFLGWTMLMIPYNAWSVELSGNYFERARLFGWRNAFGGFGGLLFTLSPLLLVNFTGTTEFTLDTMSILAWFLVIVLPGTALIAVLVVPRGTKVSTDIASLKTLWPALKKNRVMWLFITITLFAGLGQGIFVSLQFLYISAYLGLGASIAIIGSSQFVAHLLAIPMWLAIVRRFGKHKPWAASNFILAVMAPFLILVPQGQEGLLPLIAISVLAGVMSAVNAVSPQSMLADIIDYDTLKTGADRAGSYFAFLTFLSKATAGLGGGLGLMIVGLFGFVPGAENTPFAETVFLGMIAVGPALLGGFTGFLILTYPLNERRQKIIRERIVQRSQRLAMAASA